MCAYALLAGLLTLACAKAPAPEIMEADGYRFVPLTAERLPDMNEARQNHVMVCLNGEFTAIGGHTTGFVTSQSAEYFKNGKWQLVPSLYVHDDPVYAQLPDGRVLVAGGYEKDFGEIYDPATHQFSYQPILDQKRAHSNGLALEDGRVVISGNWYAKDWTEVFDGQSFVKLTDGSEERTNPYILATAPDSAIIFGIRDPHDYLLERKVDRLDGSSFEVSLLRDWEPYRYPAGDLCRYRTGNYSWLLPVADTYVESASAEGAFYAAGMALAITGPRPLGSHLLATGTAGRAGKPYRLDLEFRQGTYRQVVLCVPGL